MLILAMAALLLGAVLGLRFRVLILLPAAVVAIATMVAADSIEHSSLWTIVVDVVLALASLQMGYLAGAIAGGLMGLARSHKHPGRNLAVRLANRQYPDPHPRLIIAGALSRNRAWTGGPFDVVAGVGAHWTEVVVRFGKVVIARIKTGAIGRPQLSMVVISHPQATTGTTLGGASGRGAGWSQIGRLRRQSPYQAAHHDGCQSQL